MKVIVDVLATAGAPHAERRAAQLAFLEQRAQPWQDKVYRPHARHFGVLRNPRLAHRDGW